MSIVRPATVEDVCAIETLLTPDADKHIILPRTKDDIIQHLQEFMIQVHDDNEISGVVALHVYTSTLAEIRSLVVKPSYRGQGLGSQLIKSCETQGICLGVSSLFALTYAPDFFTNLGYAQVSKESLPHKIWGVCIHCAKFSECDEIAVKKELSSTT